MTTTLTSPLTAWGELATVTFEQGWLDAAGMPTRFLRTGDPSAPLLVLLHGTGGHAETFVRNLGALGRHFDTWAVDLVGHGRSALATEPLEIHHYVDHLAAILSAIGRPAYAITGVSMGAWIAARFAIQHPQAVSKLGLIALGGTRADPSVMSQIQGKSLDAVENPAEAVRRRLEFLVADGKSITDDLVAVRRDIYGRQGMNESMKFVLALQDPQTRARNMLQDDDLRQIRQPTQVIWGDTDPTASVDEARRITALIPDAELEVHAGVGHWPQWEQAEQFNRSHVAFLLRPGRAEARLGTEGERS